MQAIIEIILSNVELYLYLINHAMLYDINRIKNDLPTYMTSWSQQNFFFISKKILRDKKDKDIEKYYLVHG